MLVKEVDDKKHPHEHKHEPEIPHQEHEIEKHDMQMGEIASQSMEITKIAEEPLETIPKSRPDTGKDFDFLPDDTDMAEEMTDDPAATPTPEDAVDQDTKQVLVPGPDTKVYVMKDYQGGENGYEGTLVSKFKSGGDDWGVVEAQDGEMKEVPMRDITPASVHHRLVKRAIAKKQQRDAEKAKKAQADLHAIMADIKSVDAELKKEADSSVVMPMEYAITVIKTSLLMQQDQCTRKKLKPMT